MYTSENHGLRSFLLVTCVLGLLVVSYLAWEVRWEVAFPQLNIFCSQDIPTDYMVPMHLQYRVGRDTLWITGRLERRGGYSISFPKHSYEIDLPRDIRLGNLPADDDWILNANYIDKTFLRHVFSYQLFREMAPQNRAAQCAYTRLFLNGEYRGLYVLMQKLDPSSLGLFKRDSQAVIFKEPPVFRPDLTNFRPQYADNYHQQTYPDRALADKGYLLDSLRRSLLQCPDTDFRREFERWFDLDNILDWHLLLLLTNNSDGLLKNFYLYRVGGAEPFRIAPWDYDHALGRDGDNEYNFDRFIVLEKSLLFRRLLRQAWYRLALLNRWSAHQDSGLLTLACLQRRIHRLVEELEPQITENFRRWPPTGPGYYDASSFEQEVALLLRFLEMRHAQVQTQLEQLATD